MCIYVLFRFTSLPLLTPVLETHTHYAITYLNRIPATRPAPLRPAHQVKANREEREQTRLKKLKSLQDRKDTQIRAKEILIKVL